MLEHDPGIAAAGRDGRVVRPEFTGSAGEYFRVWIVNLLFTLLTLGIYSAWAKVRKKRYFYGNTRLDGDTPDYLAQPVAILKGRLVVASVVIAYFFAAEIYPMAAYIFWGVGLLVFPWLVARALAFNARNSAFRGLRFNFTATAVETGKYFIARLLLVIVSCGLALPWFLARVKSFLLGRHAYGESRFECELKASDFYRVYIRSAGIMLLALIPVISVATLAGLAGSKLGEYGFIAAMVPTLVLTYVAYALAYAYVQARTGNLLWNACRGPGIHFTSDLGAIDMAKLYLGNLVAITCTAGLLIPWAVIRTYRYRLACLSVAIDEELIHDADPAIAGIGAAGQELGDLMNVDLGI